MLEAPHLGIVDVLRSPRGKDGSPLSAGTPMPASLIHQDYPGAERVLDLLLAELEAAGLIMDVTEAASIKRDRAGTWVITPYGSRVLEFLQERPTRKQTDDP
jgi:hypothetical protein